ncbi:hypothetical protein FCL40_12010 [Ferrimonas sediminicola]|uniref:Lipoprotein n=1 Tax=Ferrimonas sediminicola TaxID=2569538 RepID=A0A4U1BBR7_9GAMM|nr:hypothetical protein [Ferrimonas sediminicola]TKB48428.1 hypothetical protein FCL40_12010 [Ferrimonas sediminicola]
MGRMANWSVVALVLALAGCTSVLHGTFVASSYHRGGDGAAPLGAVEGRSCQTQALYLFPMGEPPTTQQALDAAKRVHRGTRFLADISIDDETLWHVGYARQCIVVRATAWGTPHS